MSNSQHWYCAKSGEPRYTTIGKNGKERNTTLRDARDGSLVPSVTTINGMLSKAGLNQYFQRMAIQAALDHPKWEGESNEDYIKRLLELAKEDSKQAATRGTHIHDILDSYFSLDYVPEWPTYVYNLRKLLDATFGNRLWLSEKSFSHPEGYGGKCDLFSKADPINNLPGVVIDFKTTEKSPGELTPYTEYIMQTAAYREALAPGAICANVFINGDTNEVAIKIHKEQDLRDHYEMFLCMLKVFKLKNKL
jgi:hypothetical protein